MGATHSGINPATGGGRADLPLATAQKGFEVWRVAAPEQRAAALNKTAALIRERATPSRPAILG
jgi:succinate-semialdehyde dehydrogenase/glutarate-semialdehyde dehydrogenase